MIINGKLEGLLVIDFTAAVAGPLASQLLADSGARVIKVEPPTGDLLRKAYPIGDSEPSYYFVGVNRGKESICLDLKNSEDVEFVKKLISKADILIENFRPGVMDRFGLSYEIVKEINPSIIYASISGFGQTGPNHHRACFDLIAQAYSGLMVVNGSEHTGPSRVGFSIADISTAMWGYMAIVTALVGRERHGGGDHVDVAMVDSLFAMQVAHVVAYTALNKEPERDGNRSGAAAPFGMIPTKNGHMVLAAVSEKQWADFCRVIGMPELKMNKQFNSPAQRLKNRNAMSELLIPLFKNKTTEEWLVILEAGGIPSSPINTIEQICKSDQIRSRDMIVEVGDVKVPGNPMKFLSQVKKDKVIRAPKLGEHTQTIKNEFNN